MASVILDNVAAGVPRTEILASYPAIKSADIDAALAYAAELAGEGSIDLPAESHGVKFKIDENLPAEAALPEFSNAPVSWRTRLGTRTCRGRTMKPSQARAGRKVEFW